MKLEDLAYCERDGAILDKKGNVMCPNCQKKPAIITKYGMVRRCNNCSDIPPLNIMVNFVSHDYREADGKEAARGLSSKDPHERKLAAEALKRIRNESGRVRAMRKELVKAHQEGDRVRIKDIHEDVKKNKDYLNP